jgi:hypothetical protein
VPRGVYGAVHSVQPTGPKTTRDAFRRDSSRHQLG